MSKTILSKDLQYSGTTITIVINDFNNGSNDMLTVNKHLEVLLEEFYLDEQGEVRRSKDGYLGRFNKGDLAKFFVTSGGYEKIQVPKARATIAKAHLVYVLAGNKIPDHLEIDHIDGNRLNNKIENLRLVDRQINSKNRCKRSDNTSGVTGINWCNYKGKYVIRRVVNGKRLSRSRKTMEEALEVLKELDAMDNDYTVRHGK